jgi:hypothetical protein
MQSQSDFADLSIFLTRVSANAGDVPEFFTSAFTPQRVRFVYLGRDYESVSAGGPTQNRIVAQLKGSENCNQPRILMKISESHFVSV